jgi:alpha-glucosidase
LIKIYRDADDAHWQDNPEAYTIESFVIHSRRSLNLRLAAGGGCAVQITPIVSRKKIAKEE